MARLNKTVLFLPSSKFLHRSEHIDLPVKGHQLPSRASVYAEDSHENEQRVIKLYELCPALKFIAFDKAGLETELLYQDHFMLRKHLPTNIKFKPQHDNVMESPQPMPPHKEDKKSQKIPL